MRVVIVGAGVVGLSIAYHIKRMAPHYDILVVDMMSGAGMGDTGKSAAAFRTIFSSKLNRLLAKTTIDFYRDVQRGGWPLSMRFVGYLFLATNSEVESLKPVIGELRTMGLAIDYVDPPKGIRLRVTEDEEAREMGLDDIATGILIRDAGILDPEKVLRYYEQQFLRLGGRVAFGVKVTSLLARPKKPLEIPGEPFAWQDYRIVGIQTASGSVEADAVVLATGAWTGDLAASLGYGLPLRPHKRHVFVVKADGALRNLLYDDSLTGEGAMPFVILPRGIYVRPEPDEGNFWIGLADRRPYGFDEFGVDEALWRYGIYPVLSKYIPAFEGKTPHNSWYGYYDENVVDGVAVVDKLAEGLYVAAGTSGSGIMKADAIGRLAASLVLGKERAELYGGVEVRTDALAKNRCLEPERLIL
ncbi:NAD(P)/FAD-dependent oxidoreductase [Thermoproteus tenax]|uniref:Oxidoreductase (Deaminating) n=1 Tax=Thermoproteus tenax (strain ATCC 35583 / DSM 2078 / JCM 9277 / NBRC 100435 / Kra 1) TaxID=768679 RepID=G4RPT3_THETK|nr:FAD-binding oxidoreductase [Thermoproteus tenax]CCC81578.1 oxidoreductase (deaminating) [Thermoproteus tenax Kra 1]